MKSLTEHLWFEIEGRRGFKNITHTVEELVHKSGVQEGLCLVNAMHITASVFINDNESDFCMITKSGWRSSRHTNLFHIIATTAPEKTTRMHI